MTKHIKGIFVMALSVMLAVAALSVTAFADTATVTATIPVSVTAVGEAGTLDSDIPTEVYTFVLSAVDDAPMPEDATLTITGSGTGSFAITYSKVGVYRYTVTQDASALTGENSTCNNRGSYEDTVYYVVITVTNATEGLALDVTVSAHEEDFNGSKPDCLNYENSYAPVPYDSLTVVVTWEDNDQTRPDSVEVTLMDGTEVVEVVTLSEENDWTYTWDRLDPYGDHDWNVIQSEVEGYTTEYTTEGNMITILNVGDVNPVVEESSDTLAQTGQLVWPIALFCLLGVCAIVAGMYLMKDKKKNID